MWRVVPGDSSGHPYRLHLEKIAIEMVPPPLGRQVLNYQIGKGKKENHHEGNERKKERKNSNRKSIAKSVFPWRW